MGVRGITTYLRDTGLLDTTQPDYSKLWKEWTSALSFQLKNPPQVLEPGSILLIDANGLAFFLYHVAYCRHVLSVTKKYQDNTTGGAVTTCPSIRSLSEQEVLDILPSFMPMSLLEDITKEFARGISNRGVRVELWWDGPSRRFKELTHEKRRTTRLQEWDALLAFCQHGTLPVRPDDPAWDLLDHLPVPGMFLRVVKDTLHKCKMKMKYCREEADVELARQASGKNNCFILASDSDFWFYKDVQYIPFESFYVPTNKKMPLRAVYWTRSQIADKLGLTESEVVELAMLLGNDYVDNKTLVVPSNVKYPTDAVPWLRQQPDDFRLESENVDAPELEFVRALYNLEGLDAFPATDDDSGDEEGESLHESVRKLLCIPDVDFIKTKGMPMKGKPVDFILSVLNKYVEQCSAVDDNDGPVLTKRHLTAYLNSVNPTLRVAPRGKSSRPNWKDVRAGHIIEECVSSILSATRRVEILRTIRPSKLVESLRFQDLLLDRSNDVIAQQPNQAITPGKPERQSKQRGPQQGARNVPSQPPKQESSESIGSVERPRLPIDEHESTIMNSIRDNRITIIHGETGCGKSSRVPVMIMESPSPEPSLPSIKMFISQPRRIAAAALVKRVRSSEKEHGDKFAIRMGHGYREFESRKTQAWFVTTGYLTRLMAASPEYFDSFTHIVIDEVHERSVDTDILCLLCRRMLQVNKTVRLVLMSATLATKLYKDYFDVPNEPIHVGVRLFPIKEYFVEDFNQLKLPSREMKVVNEIVTDCTNKRCRTTPAAGAISSRCNLATTIASFVGGPGSSVLIFVPGMMEIVNIMESIERLYRPGVRFVGFPIHSDIPFEDQMSVFAAPEPDEVRIIVATNAAESSVTLPAVDHVICLGLCKQITYNERSHRQMLTPAWISRASAKQRAGRTGRIRPGNVYRLYTREAYEQFIPEFEVGEMTRIPLDSVILSLKDMLKEEVTPVLLDCIEPPPLTTIDNSFQSLNEWHFLSRPDDEGHITSMGKFASATGIDLRLASLIGLGIQFGVAAEAIEMAATFSAPKTPFQISNPLFHSPEEYNTICSATYIAKCHFDANLYSEPLGLMNALWDYEQARDRHQFCTKFRFSHARMSQLNAARHNLRKRVAEFLEVHEEKLRLECPPVKMCQAKLTMLRTLCVWTFSDALIMCSRTTISNISNDGSCKIPIKNKTKGAVSEELFGKVLDPVRHPFSLSQTVSQSGTVVMSSGFDFKGFIDRIKGRWLSYMCEKDIDLVYLSFQDFTFLFFSDTVSVPDEVLYGNKITMVHDPMKTRQGIAERSCGMWSIKEDHNAKKSTNDVIERHFIQSFSRQKVEKIVKEINQWYFDGMVSYPMGCTATANNKKKNRKKKGKGMLEANSEDIVLSLDFKVTAKGGSISAIDVHDLWYSPHATIDSTEAKVYLHFQGGPNAPMDYPKGKKDGMATLDNGEGTTWTRPLCPDAVEGARLLSVLTYGLRVGGARLRIPEEKGGSKDNPGPMTEVFLGFDRAQRWSRLDGGNVIIGTDSVPVSAISTSRLYATCANGLDLKGGAIKVEHITMLPPNPLYLVMALATFGKLSALPGCSHLVGLDDDSVDEVMVDMMHSFVRTDIEKCDVELGPVDILGKMRRAVLFNQSSMNMGEHLVCNPKHVKDLLDLFSDIGDGPLGLWDTLEERCLSIPNLRKWRSQWH
eukprot:Nitzschia sp. Nitz4//scaffold120_size68122//58196//63238//NITZ4_006055-RA/size68122-processed-gene-0.41-mRNA-1//1//CDS//3329534311//2355//frame0